jgi:hypothetical protein
MTNKTDLIQEIYARISSQIGEGLSLEGIKQVRIGTIEEARKDNDLPIINIQLINGKEEANFHNNAYVDNMSIGVTLIHTKNISTSNTLFYTENNTRQGALPLFEKLLDVLDKNTDGVVDISFSQKANNLRSFSYALSEDAGIVEIQLVIDIQTKIFMAGAR